MTVSLDFPTIISLATTRFFRKCFATAHAGHTVILIGGFRDKPSNRKIRNRSSRISAAAHHYAHILLIFPSNTFPAGTVRGWPESPDDDHHQHNRYSLHERFGVPAQPTKMNPHMANRHVSLAVHPCNTHVITVTPQPTTRANSLYPPLAYIGSPRSFEAPSSPIKLEGIAMLYYGANGRLVQPNYDISTFPLHRH